MIKKINNLNDSHRTITFIDFCAGIGGERLGLEHNGFKCLGFSEIDKQAEKLTEPFLAYESGKIKS